MLKLALGIVLLTQLSAPGNNLPQVLAANFRTAAPVRVAETADVTVSFAATNGYVINHTPPITLKLTAVSGVQLETLEFTTASEDVKSADEYYVDLPTLRVPVRVARAGRYEIPAQVIYYFCNKADGFCARQTLDTKITLQVQ